MLVCVSVGLAGSWIVGSLMVRGHASLVLPVPHPATDFMLKASDGTRIAATYRPGRTPDGPAVLLLHGVRASRQATAPNAAWLSRQGYATLTIDFRGHGDSGLRNRSFGIEEARDADAAFRWLKRRQRGAPVAIVGISLGGAAALLGESGPLPADALVLQAVYPDLRSAIRNRIASRLGRLPAILLEPLLSVQTRLRHGVPASRVAPIAAVTRYRGPLLLIGGLDDRSTPAHESRAMFAAARGSKALWLVPGKSHEQMSDLRDEAYRARVATFLASTIGRP